MMSRVSFLVLLSVFCILCNCYAHRNLDITASPHVQLSSGGLSLDDTRDSGRTRSTLQYFYPSTLKSIYDVADDLTLGAGKTIAFIEAYGASTAERDLGQFSTTFGLPQATTANGLFLKVNQTGGSEYPPDDLTSNWALEAALDIQAAHAFAPGAKLLLIVCNSNSFDDLFAGVEYAMANADYVSMSWGSPEGSWVPFYEGILQNSDVSFFASTGDKGSASGVQYPASSLHVVAVGGTSVYTNPDYSLVSELGWSGSGGGCSTFTPAISSQQAYPGYQGLGCNGFKALPDVSMAGDPQSGLLIYLSQNGGQGTCVAPNCFWIAGGTSLAAPLVAARAAGRGVEVNPEYMYSGNIHYRDTITGTNGAFSCQSGLDLVTGTGTWVGAY